jgi:uncharacterized protein (DUF2235 family)
LLYGIYSKRAKKHCHLLRDGTGNQFGDHNSNVVRLYTCLDVNSAQVAYYHPGVGTLGAPNRTTRIGKKVSQTLVWLSARVLSATWKMPTAF